MEPAPSLFAGVPRQNLVDLSTLAGPSAIAPDLFLEEDHVQGAAFTAATTLAEVAADQIRELREKQAGGFVGGRAHEKPAGVLRRLGWLGARPVGEVTAGELDGWRAEIERLYGAHQALRSGRIVNTWLAHARSGGAVLSKLDPPGPAPGTLAAVAADWLDAERRRAASGELADNGYQHASRLASRLAADDLGATPIAEVDTAAARAWYGALADERGARYAEQYVHLLGGLMTWARAQGHAARAVTHGVITGRTREEAARAVTGRTRGGRQTPAAPAAPLQLVRPPAPAPAPRLTGASPVGAAIDLWLAESERRAGLNPPQIKKGTVRAYRYTAAHLRTEFAGRQAIADWPLADLDRSIVEDWVLAVAETIGSALAESCLERLRIVLELARARGALKGDPTHGVKFKHERKPPRPPTLDELREIRSTIELLCEQRHAEGGLLGYRGIELARYVSPYALLRSLLFCGARIDEVAQIEAWQVQGTTLALVKTKTGKPRKVEIDATAAALIERQIALGCLPAMHGQPASGRVFPFGVMTDDEPEDEQEQRYLESLKDHVRRLMERVCRLVGLAKPYPHPHDLRHAFIVNALELGHSNESVMGATGHDCLATMQDIYGGRNAQRPGSKAITGDLDQRTRRGWK